MPDTEFVLKLKVLGKLLFEMAYVYGPVPSEAVNCCENCAAVVADRAGVVAGDNEMLAQVTANV